MILIIIDLVCHNISTLQSLLITYLNVCSKKAHTRCLASALIATFISMRINAIVFLTLTVRYEC
jgi:hypothetical protein